MSRIVYVSNARLPTERAHGLQIMKMCEGMGALGHDVELLHPQRDHPDRAVGETDPFEYYGVKPTFRVRTLPFFDPLRLERWVPGRVFWMLYAASDAGWGLFAVLRAARSHPDLIYTRSKMYAYFAARLGQPCVLEDHIPPSPRSTRLLRGFSRRPSARAVVTITSYTATHLEAAGVPRDKIDVLPDAADLSAFADPQTKEDARRQLDLPLDRQIIGYVGRFVTLGREKGVRDLIQAVATPELRALDPLLVCVGGPREVVTEYEELARSLGVPSSSLRFVDHVRNPEVPTWMAALDIGAVPAPGEGKGAWQDAALDHYGDSTSPLKLFEYMAAGLPIVAANLAGIGEVIDDGENGLLVPPGDTAALAAACRKILEDAGLAGALGERARRDATQYSWDQRAERALASALTAPPRVAEPTSGT